MSAELMLLLGLLAIFIAIVLLLTTIGTITAERQAVNRSLAAVQAIQTAPKSMQAELDQPFKDRVTGPALRNLTRFGRRFTPADQADRIKHRLEVAGNPENWDVDRVIAFKVLGLFGGHVERIPE